MKTGTQAPDATRFHLLLKWLPSRKQMAANGGINVGPEEAFSTAGRNIEWSVHEPTWRRLRTIQLELLYAPAICAQGILRPATETHTRSLARSLLFIIALFTILRKRGQLRCLSTDEWLGKCSLQKQCNFIEPQRKTEL